MNRKYERLMLDRDEQPESKAKDFFKRMAIGGRFRFLFCKHFDSKHPFDSPFDHNNPLSVKILSVRDAPRGLYIIIDTKGEVTPPGIRHFCCSLFFYDNLICDNLPDEIFED